MGVSPLAIIKATVFVSVCCKQAKNRHRRKQNRKYVPKIAEKRRSHKNFGDFFARIAPSVEALSQCRIVLIAPLWPQSLWFSKVLQLLVSAPICLPLFPKLLTQAKGKLSKSPITLVSCFGVTKQSIRDKRFSQRVADFVSKSRRTSTQKVYDAKWVLYSNWCHRKKVNPVTAPLTVIADFLIYLFSEKKYQISTIKSYRTMISNTLKFKTGNRIRSNPVLSD